MKRTLVVLIALLLLTGGVRADITSNLVAHWKLDETSGTSAADSSGSGYTGTYVNTPTLNQTGAFGSSKAVTFASASSQYVSASPSLSSGAAGSLAFWFFQTGSQPSGARHHCAVGANSSNFMATETPTTSTIRGRITVGGVTTTTSSHTPGNNTWRHYVVTWSNAHLAFYADGGLVQSVGISVTVPAATSSTVASFLTGAGGVNGTIDDVRIYSRALSSDDVAELYAYTGTRFPYWYFNSSGCDPFKVFRTRQPLAIVTTR